MVLRPDAADQLATLAPLDRQQAEAVLVPVALPAVEARVTLLTRLHAGEVPREVRVGIPPRDRLAVAVTKAAQHEALGLDHSVRTVVVSITVGTKPALVLTARMATLCSAFTVRTTSTSGRSSRSRRSDSTLTA